MPPQSCRMLAVTDVFGVTSLEINLRSICSGDGIASISQRLFQAHVRGGMRIARLVYSDNAREADKYV